MSRPQKIHKPITGAFNAILSLDADQRAAGIVAHSSGNYAQAVAFAAARLGVRAVVVMPSDAPAIKIEGVRRSAAELVQVDLEAGEKE